MRLTELPLDDLRFRTSEDVREPIRRACAANPDLATFHHLGESEEGRPIYGVTLGFGPETVTLVAGAHADEPVGPETLRTLILELLANRDWLADGDGFHELLERVTFRIVPHVNPDGEAANRPWIERWPDLGTFLSYRRREAPGRDLEFGYPVMRPENRAASRYLLDYTPLALHTSLHGMAVAEGALLLIERHWADATERLRADWRTAVSAAGLGLHDHDRGGAKGFLYLGPGFWSTPEGTAMREHFLALGDTETASQFHLSSMEMARIAGYDASRDRHPLCLVTELPLFVVEAGGARQPGAPAAVLALKDALPELEARARSGEDVRAIAERFRIRPLSLADGVRLQLRAIELGLERVGLSDAAIP